MLIKMGRNKWARHGGKSKSNLQNKKFKDFIAKNDLNNDIEIKGDYDIVICIPSFNRYKLIKRLLTQLYTQKTKHKFLVILIDDGSTDISYFTLKKEFNELIYLRNNDNFNRQYHWKLYELMWRKLKTLTTKYVIQMDDDFILCDNFLDTVIKLYKETEIKYDNLIGIAPHTYEFLNNKIKNKDDKRTKNNIDGIGVFDIKLIKKLNYKLDGVKNKINDGVTVGVWQQIKKVCDTHNFYIHRTEKTYVLHDDAGDSKLHSKTRKIKKIKSINLINSLNKYRS